MGLKTKEKTIQGLNFACTSIPARRSLKLQFKLAKLILPFLGELMGGIKGDLKKESLLDADVSSEAIASAVNILMDKLDEDSFYSLVMEVFQHTAVNGVAIDSNEKFDNAFNGNPLAVYEGLLFVLEMEYGDLFLGGKGIGKLLNQNPPGTKAKGKQKARQST